MPTFEPNDMWHVFQSLKRDFWKSIICLHCTWKTWTDEYGFFFTLKLIASSSQKVGCDRHKKREKWVGSNNAVN